MAAAGCIGGHRRLLDTAPAPAGDDRAGSNPGDAMRIMVGVLVTVVFCTLLYCIYCWRWQKRNGEYGAQTICSGFSWLLALKAP